MELEDIIAELIRRKYAAPERSAERELIKRQLNGLRLSNEAAGPIMEDLDPLEWGSTDRPTSRAGGRLLQFRKSVRSKPNPA